MSLWFVTCDALVPVVLLKSFAHCGRLRTQRYLHRSVHSTARLWYAVRSTPKRFCTLSRLLYQREQSAPAAGPRWLVERRTWCGYEDGSSVTQKNMYGRDPGIVAAHLLNFAFETQRGFFSTLTPLPPLRYCIYSCNARAAHNINKGQTL